MTATAATVPIPDTVNRKDRNITYRWEIPATAAPDFIEAVELIVSHNKHRKTIDAVLHCIAVRGPIVSWSMSLSGRGPSNAHTLSGTPCSRYSAKQLEAAHTRAVALLAARLEAQDPAVAEIFEEQRHYDARG